MPNLFDPLKIRSLTLRNRLGVSPMCMYSSQDGHATDWHLVHLGSRAVGGYALVMAEATAIEARGRISPHDAGLWTDSQIEPLARITRFLKEYGAIPAIQIAHAGRKASTRRPWERSSSDGTLPPSAGGWPIVGPSAIPFGDHYETPAALTIPEIHSIQANFVAAAKRSLAAGYEILEIHAAHGYLFHEFLSPLANTRTDAYGGSFENRTRMLLESTRQIRQVWPESLPLFVRLSCTDWIDDALSWTLEDSIALARLLKTEGVDLIDCSSGGMVPYAKIKTGPGYQVPFAEAIRRAAGILSAAVGMITEAQQAAAIIAEERADLVFTARHALRDPYFPAHAARELKLPAPPPPPQYLRAW